MVGASRQALCLRGGSVPSRGLGLSLRGRGGHHGLGATARHHSQGSSSTLGFLTAVEVAARVPALVYCWQGSSWLQAVTHVAVRACSGVSSSRDTDPTRLGPPRPYS